MRPRTSKLRYYFKLTIAFVKRFKGVVLLSAIIGVAVFFTFRLIFTSFLTTKLVKVGINGRYTVNDLPDHILNRIGEGLTAISEDKSVKPGLADSWSTPDEGKTWVFDLKDGLVWQDGNPVTSTSLTYEFSDVNIETPDSDTITFKLNDPYAPFPAVVSKPTFQKGLLGTGDWQVTKISLNGNYIEMLTVSDNKTQNIEYRFYPTTERTKLAYKLGEVDVLYEMLDPSPFLDWQNSNYSKNTKTDQVVTLFFNTGDPLLGDKSIRQALVYAINKQEFGERAIGPISPDSWAFNPQVKSYSFDIERASELLEEVPDELKNDTEIKLVTTPILLSTAERIAEYWNEIGIRSVIQVSSIIPEEYQAFLTILDIPDDPDQYPIWHSTQNDTNISNYQNPRIDKLLEDGRSTLDNEERRKIYLDFQRFLLEDTPAAFLYHPTYYTVTRK